MMNSATTPRRTIPRSLGELAEIDFDAAAKLWGAYRVVLDTRTDSGFIDLSERYPIGRQRHRYVIDVAAPNRTLAVEQARHLEELDTDPHRSRRV